MTHGPHTLAEVPLIPRSALFGNPEHGSTRISPCGTWLAFTAPLDGVLNLWVCKRDDDPASARPLTQDIHRGIDSCTWSFDGEHLLFEQDVDGDENFHLMAVPVGGGPVRDLTPAPGARGLLHSLSRRKPQSVLITLNERDPSYADLFSLDLPSGELRLLEENPGFEFFWTDDDFRVLLASRANEDGSVTLMRRDAVAGWQPWQSIPRIDATATQPLHFDADGRTLYMMDNRGRDTTALVSVDIQDDAGVATVLAADARADVGTLIEDVNSHRPLAYLVDHERSKMHVLGSALQRDVEFLDKLELGDWRLTSRSSDDAFWVIFANGDTQPPSVHLYDRRLSRARKLYDCYPALADAPLARMQHMTLRARDDLPLVSYLTLPVHADDRRETLSSTAALPMVLLVHGGPWVRDEWGYHPEHQWLANRGYAVLSVNFRGSTGFGKTFTAAGDLEWGAKMSDDLLDAVGWAVALGIADPERIAIMGGSYGGYAVLWALTNDPLRFACGVDIVGPSNLETLIDSMPPHWESERAMVYQQVGNPTTAQGRKLLRERSPLHRANRIKRPLLIGQGANDPRVKRSEADQMAAALKASGIPVTYALYPDEGHGFHRPANNIAFNVIVERFLARHLGGRFEPASAQEIDGHSTVMLEGEEDAPM